MSTILISTFIFCIILIIYRWTYRNSEKFVDAENYDLIISEEMIPSNINLTADVNNGYIKLYWMPPEIGFDDLKLYMINVKDLTNNTNKFIEYKKVKCTNCSYNLPINNYHKYEIYIFAINDYGIGEKSNIIKVNAKKKPPPPKDNVIKKNIMITCLKDGNFIEGQYCNNNKIITPKIDMYDHDALIYKLNQNVKKYNFDIA